MLGTKRIKVNTLKTEYMYTNDGNDKKNNKDGGQKSAMSKRIQVFGVNGARK